MNKMEQILNVAHRGEMWFPGVKLATRGEHLPLGVNFYP
jgi:hypothetical protein